MNWKLDSKARYNPTRRTVLATALALATAGSARAQQTYPSRPVRIIVPTGAGAALDTIARGMAMRLEAHLGAPFVVENKPGANSTIGSEFVARSEPDGYTLLYTGQAISVNPSLYKLSYDAEKSFAPVATIATAPITMVVPPNSPYANVRDLLGAAKSKPGGLTYGSAGRGSPPYVAAELFQQKAGVTFTHVPYKGAAPALTDLLGERLDLMFPSLTLAKGFIAAGKVRVLGIASEQRTPLAPDIPTIQDMGLPGFATSSWSGIVAPAGTPDEIVARLQTAISEIMAKPDMKEFFSKQGLDPNFRDRHAFAKLIHEETANFAQMLANAKDK
jgi:tripartite-type tricarboxylate transporter receptor subunit TctC